MVNNIFEDNKIKPFISNFINSEIYLENSMNIIINELPRTSYYYVNYINGNITKCNLFYMMRSDYINDIEVFKHRYLNN